MIKDYKVLLTTFVYGVKYQAYIPLLIYSCNKAYPEYDILLFINGDLDPIIKKQVDCLNYHNVIIRTNSFDDCPNMSPRTSQCLRWVLWDDSFLCYDYVYIIDIDMFYIRESLPLHIQHVKHIQTTGLSFDNIRRKHTRQTLNITSLLQRYKYARFRKFFKYVFGDKVEFRATGLHFISTGDYYNYLTPERIEYYKQLIYTDRWTDLAMYPNDEVLLYHILKNEGLNPEKMPLQTNSYVSLDFENCTRSEFRPHHGIHLGIFRKDISCLSDSDKLILESSAYKYYICKFVEQHLHDEVFLKILNSSPEFISKCFENIVAYYGLY